MAEWHYTDQWRRQFGPMEDSVLLELNESGAITGETVVWRVGMPEWLPWHKVAGELLEKDEQGNVQEVGVCAHTGKVQLRKDMIPYGSALIGVESKQDFVQSLMETGRTMVEDVTEASSKYVGFWWRLLGILLDEMVKYGIMLVLGGILLAIFIGIMTKFGDSVATDVFSGFFMGGLLLVIYGAGALYEILMVGKYQGTLGKLVIGAKVVQPDDSRVSYKRSFGRWLAKSPICVEAIKILPYIMFFFFIGLIGQGFESNNTAMIIASCFLGVTVPLILTIVISSVFWMAAFDDEKRALHDRITSTRVIHK